MNRSYTHFLPACLAIAITAVLLTGCNLTVSGDDVEEQARALLGQQVPVDSVDCPDSLPGEVGARITCTLVSDGTPRDLVVVVTEVDGSQVNFDMELQPIAGAPAPAGSPGAQPDATPQVPSVSASEVEAQSLAVFSQQFPVDSVSCDEGLPARVGATITCVLVSEGKSFEMTVIATEVEGDDVNFDLELTKEL